MQPGADGGGGNSIRGGGRSRGGTRGYGGRGMTAGEQSVPINEGGSSTLGHDASFARSRGGGGEQSTSINQGYGGGNYGQSRGYGGRGRGSGEYSAPINEGGSSTLGHNASFARSRGGGGEQSTSINQGYGGGNYGQSRGYGGRGMTVGEQSTHINEGGSSTLVHNASFARSRGGGGEQSTSINQGYSGGNYGQSRGYGGRGRGSGEYSAPIDEGGGYTRGRNPSFTRSRGGGSGDLGGETSRPQQGPSTSQGYGFRVGDYSRRGEGTQNQLLPPSMGTSAVRQQSFSQSRGYGGGPRGGQRQGSVQEIGYNAAPAGIKQASLDQTANDDWAKQNREAVERNKDVVLQETPIKPPEKVAVVEETPEKQVDRTEQKLRPTFQQAPAPIRQPASELPKQKVSAVQKPAPSEVTRSTTQQAPAPIRQPATEVPKQKVSAVQKPASSEVTSSSVQQAPAPVANASNAGGDIATAIVNAATDEQIQELGRLVDTLSQTFTEMSVLIKSLKK